MSPAPVLSVSNQALKLALMLGAPLLLTSLVGGLLIGLFQAATQINEMTLSFIPKVIAMAAVVVATGPWMLRLLVDYTRQLIENLPMLVG